MEARRTPPERSEFLVDVEVPWGTNVAKVRQVSAAARCHWQW
jgi:hypothetical protein